MIDGATIEWAGWHIVGGYVLILLTAGSTIGFITCAMWQVTVWMIRNYYGENYDRRYPPKSPNHPSVQQ